MTCLAFSISTYKVALYVYTNNTIFSLCFKGHEVNIYDWSQVKTSLHFCAAFYFLFLSHTNEIRSFSKIFLRHTEMAFLEADTKVFPFSIISLILVFITVFFSLYAYWRQIQVLIDGELIHSYWLLSWITFNIKNNWNN